MSIPSVHFGPRWLVTLWKYNATMVGRVNVLRGASGVRRPGKAAALLKEGPGLEKVARPYFSERAGRTEPGPISINILRTVFEPGLFKFIGDGYFQVAFGKECPDGNVTGSSGMDMRAAILLRFGEGRGQKLFPYPANIQQMAEDDIFDLLEFLHDHSAKPMRTRNHTWDNCGIHVEESSADQGQSDWRDHWNPTLARVTPGYRVTEFGTVEVLPQNEGLRALVDHPVTYGNPENVDEKVARATRQFLARHASPEQQQEAIRHLADALEFLRADVKNSIPRGDESALFNLANNFGIRHNNLKQQTEYDKTVYYPWIFHTYLATIDLMSRLKARGAV